MNPRDLSYFDNELNELDRQIAILKEKRSEIAQEREKVLPNGLDVLMDNTKKNSSIKRKHEAIEDDNTYKELKKILDVNKTCQSNEVLEDLTLEEQSLFKKIKITRQVYPEKVKKLTIELTKKFTKKKVNEATKISVENIKKWVRNDKKGLTSSKRGRRVTYPDLEENLKEWLKKQRNKKIMFQSKDF